MFTIRLADCTEFDKVRLFYHLMTENLMCAEYSPGWKRDIYPTPDYLRESIDNKELYIGEMDGQYVSVMIINHEANEGYEQIEWPTKAEAHEIYMIHALGVHPDFFGKGLADKMVREVFSLGKKNGVKVVRLDVLKGNVPAEKLYEKIGFKQINTIQMYYEDTGWTDYELYEYVL
ncbi:GNAT family N-acetyltransferase [Lachnospiraceae bacterium OttesenSCG-928-D06]|nr:GNAT family N-acetyltransferase [Lachnospiraceae bacterium OttesenSCG-928-D06]